MFESGSTSSCSSMPSASRMNARRAWTRRHSAGSRAASSPRSASSASAMPSSMFEVKHGVPVAGMMSTCIAEPERSSTCEPGPTGDATHSSRWSRCPGLRKIPKNGSPSRRSTMSWRMPPAWPTRSAKYHSATASKYGATSRST